MNTTVRISSKCKKNMFGLQSNKSKGIGTLTQNLSSHDFLGGKAGGGLGKRVMAGRKFRFEIIKQSTKSRARVGRIVTPHGSIKTPAFVPVGTNGVLKAVNHDQSEAAGTELMFSNTYHLMVHPGPETIHKLGGIHKWSGRNKPFITDSGGFQVFSLAGGKVTGELKSRNTKRKGLILKISEDGVTFRSYRDGKKIELTPESTVQAQKLIGADIIIPLDELPPSGAEIDREELKKSVEKSMRWEKRSLEEHLKHPKEQAMYAVVHGALDQSLRKYSSAFLSELPFDGFAVGGSLGRSVEDAANVLDWVMPHLPSEKPVHLLGLADQGMLRMGTQKGVDSFDSCFPTKAARHGTAFVNIRSDGSSERLHLKSGKHAESPDPLDSNCDCYACRNHSKAYMHHLLKMHEPVVATLISIHNIHHTHKIMETLRKRILAGAL